MNKKIVAFAGGVGGAKLVDGLSKATNPENLTVIVNTGDDFEYLGLNICPDLDTICYTLAGINNPLTGWGRYEETWNAFNNINLLGGPSWFHLGDKDLGLHLERTRKLKDGMRLSNVTQDFLKAWNVKTGVFPMSDDPVRTMVDTKEYGEITFQEYFVKNQYKPVVKGFRFEGAESAQMAKGASEAIHSADIIVFCPSNPWVSIDPILAIPGIQEAIKDKMVIAVSPIIGSETVKGPAAKIYREMGIEPSCVSVASHYHDKISGIIIDEIDKSLCSEIKNLGIEPLVTKTLMQTSEDRRKLAEDTIGFYNNLELNRLLS
ncbi:MAG: 2-phospho-L-lactate transferase [Bacteroidales bacterium]|nr:2-phospho-L-lactate transferase [Bacteroidales bacterium]